MPVPGGLGWRSPRSIALGRPRSPQTATRSAPRRRQRTLRGRYRTRAASLACQYGSSVAPAPGRTPARRYVTTATAEQLDPSGDSAGCALKLRTQAGADAAAICMRLVASARRTPLRTRSRDAHLAVAVGETCDGSLAPRSDVPGLRRMIRCARLQPVSPVNPTGRHRPLPDSHHQSQVRTAAAIGDLLSCRRVTSAIGVWSGRRQHTQAPAGLRASGAKCLDLGDARIVQQLLVQGRFNRDQRDLALGVVVNAPAVALWQRRYPKVRVALAQELLALFEPDRLRDLMEDRVYVKGNIFLGVLVRTIDEQFVLNQCLRLLGPSRWRLLSFGDWAVIGDFKSVCRT